MSSDDDADYMSDEYLVKCSKSGPNDDIRPGLIHDRTKKREIDIQRRKAESDEKARILYKPRAQRELERREEGLREAIPASNKGFALLQKMGFKPGSAIGKSGVGVLEPVSLKVKSGRGGLGRETAVQEVREARLLAMRRWRLRREEEAEIGIKDYRMRIAAETRKRQAEADLRVCQKACLHLDEESGFADPLEKWFWPPVSKDEESSSGSEVTSEEEEEVDTTEACKRNKSASSKSMKKAKDDDLQPEEKLDILTEYLRKNYLYCSWCGTKFDGDEDIASNCPGKSRDDH